ncbi:MAG TPA: thiamine-phosphate kinase [Candidatus Binatia bacterium]|nr:thiamine-phosphate kinase [Candidatus Binatia bacterium]
MKLSRLGEFGLIQKIRRAMPAGRGVRIGIGDDAAWVNNPMGSSLVTADLLIENVHFDLKWIPLYDLGYKSLAVNLSDIAAMGGVAAYAILSLGIPGNFDSQKVDEFYRGVKALARKTRVAIVGGDTNIADSLIVSVCVIAHPPRRPICRSGAKVGDDIYVTGTLGDSALGLKLLRQGKRQLKNRHFAKLIARHHRPTPRLSVGARLAGEGLATAMIDVSDGLLQDLGHVCRASATGAMIFNDRLPLSRAYRAVAGKGGTCQALSGGEDYELLFCARRKNRGRIEKLAQRAHLRITRIGTCVSADRGVHVVDSSGKLISTRILGHDHFKRS